MNDLSESESGFDAMPPRRLVARWVLTARLQTKTATHFGGRADSALDMPILRCSRTARPLLPGSTLGGALRAYLLDRFAGYGLDSANLDDSEQIDRQQVAALFGGSRADDEGGQSPLIVFDALGSLPAASSQTEIRDGVLIEAATGTAAAHKKFDFEVIPPGTTFDIRFDVMVPRSSVQSESNLLALLLAALSGLDDGDICIGLRRSRGLGEISTDHWTAHRYDLTTREGWLEWIDSDHESPVDLSPTGTAKQAIESTAPLGLTLQAIADQRERVIIDVEADVVGELLIRSPNDSATGPDVGHLKSGNHPVLSGTSLAGSMRAHALKIAQLVHGIDPDGAEEHYITPLFGPREEGTRNPEFKPRASRLRVAERPVNGGTDPHVTRIAIDRFTQGVIPTALFEEQPHAGGAVVLRFEIHNPRPGQLGLLLLVLRDLLTGRVSVGGASAVGRGVLQGKRLMVRTSAVPGPLSLEFANGQPQSHDMLDQQVQEFVSDVPVQAEQAGAIS